MAAEVSMFICVLYLFFSIPSSWHNWKVVYIAILQTKCKQVCSKLFLERRYVDLLTSMSTHKMSVLACRMIIYTLEFKS